MRVLAPLLRVAQLKAMRRRLALPKHFVQKQGMCSGARLKLESPQIKETLALC